MLFVARLMIIGSFFTQAQQIRSGPLVGHTTKNSVKIWAYQGDGLPMEVLVVRQQQVNEEQTTTRKAMVLPRDESSGSSIVTIESLQYSTKYTYEILVEGSRVAKGQFKTAPRRGPIEFQYLLASCINVHEFKGDPNQPVWYVILGQQTKFAMLAGDTVYVTGQGWDGNGVRCDRVLSRNMDQRDECHFANVVRNVPTYVVGMIMNMVVTMQNVNKREKKIPSRQGRICGQIHPMGSPPSRAIFTLIFGAMCNLWLWTIDVTLEWLVGL